MRYGFSPRDYKCFGFDTINLTEQKRKAFLSDWEKDALLIKKEGWNNYLELNDKYGFYKNAHDYFFRQVFFVDVSTVWTDFEAFAISVRDLFIKPNSGSYGIDARVEYVDTVEKARIVFEKLMATGCSWMVEERIRQDEEMARWNHSSVNTVRFSSCLTKENGFHPFTPFIRTGRSGSVVDNAGSGGIFANVDIKTGVIYTDGISESGITYEMHPDSGCKFKGWQIPNWDLLISTAERLHREVFPNHCYVGWDFALSKGRWVLIEGNWGQFVNQYADKKGRKQEFKQFLKGNIVNKMQNKNE